MHPLPPAVYVFRAPDGRCLYVGKAGTSPGDRFQDHYRRRRPWALQATRIDVHWLPYGSDLDAAEQALIRRLAPPGNQQHNRGRYDRAWARKVELQAARTAGHNIPWTALVGLRWLEARALARRVGRTLATVVVVDVALAVGWVVLTAYTRGV